MTWSPPGVVLTCLLGGALMAPPSLAGPSGTERTAQLEAPSLDDVLERAAAYVGRFVEQLSTVVMEEDYRQNFFSGGRSNPVRLRLVSEFLLVQVPGDAAWIGFRDVFEVDGQRVRDRQDRLASLFLGGTTVALNQARRISEESARYNLGTTGRTFNVPTYALFYLHPDNVARFEFEPDGEGCGNNRDAWKIRFEEVALPTLTRGLEGIDLPSRGRFCVDPSNGRVIETELELHHPSISGRPATDASATVTFGPAPDLDLWVPVEMRERYTEGGGRWRTNSTATYRGFRQFSVSVSENTDVPEEPAEPQ